MFDMLGELAGGAATGGLSVIFGGLTGLVGGWLNNRHQAKLEQLKIERDTMNNAHSLAEMKYEAESVERIAAISADETKFAKDIDGMVASMANDSATYSKGWANRLPGWAAAFVGILLALVDVVRGLIRPTVTAYMVYQLHMVWEEVRTHIAWATMPACDQLTIALRVLDMILYLTGLSVGWYFGSRAKPVKH